MNRPKVEPVPAGEAKSKDAKKAPRPSRYLEFSLATTDVKPEKTP
jgi:hypothetical protein